MPTFRNISPDDLTIPIAGRWVKVPVGGVVTVAKPDTYWQTGDQGEVPLFEIVGEPAAKVKGSPSGTTSTEGK